MPESSGPLGPENRDEPRASQSPDSSGTGYQTPFEGDNEYLRSALPAYSITQRLAVGGQGVVYRAVNGDGTTPVAIKVLLDGPLSGERETLRLQHEAGILKRLKHANIVALLDAGVLRGRPYLVFEYVDGVAIDD